jgi:hypothetical protein
MTYTGDLQDMRIQQLEAQNAQLLEALEAAQFRLAGLDCDGNYEYEDCPLCQTREKSIELFHPQGTRRLMENQND